MAEDQLLRDFDKHIASLKETASWIEKLYYDPEFSSVFNRPAISMLKTGVSFLITNLTIYRDQWQEKIG